ncbi:MAG TPA: flagellar biosynthetic protein FliQ [Anaeromyxobacteraceae bacterium]|nr:flagellar biosynthetic protein FliQ [Anaeromyxobacteraceae bacterium]
MTPELPSALLREGLVLLGTVGAPLFAAALLVGLLVGVLQAATQINDPATGFLPRAAAAVLVAWFAGPWMVGRLAAFLASAITRMSGHGG